MQHEIHGNQHCFICNALNDNKPEPPPYFSHFKTMPDTIEASNRPSLQDASVPDTSLSEALLPSLLPEIPESSAYSNICDLIRDKTRFEPGDVEMIEEQDDEQIYDLEVRYSLEARVETLKINGFFVRTTRDHECDAPFAFVQCEAEDECPSRLKQAAAMLTSGLEQSETAYNSIAEGLLLEHDCKHWHLDDCISCSGSGRVDCHTCHGRRQETCWHCHGNLYIICNAYGCIGGRQDCPTCGGRGHISRQVSYQVTVQVPTTTWSNGVSQTSYHTEYRTEYRTEQEPCTNYNCLGGRVQCGRCSGTGQIQCPTCFATGKVTCRTCGGVGDLTCEPCSGSRKLGNAAWVDVYAKPTYHLQLPDGCPDDALAIMEREGPHGIAAISRTVGLATTEVDKPEGPSVLAAIYRGLLRIVRLDTRCNGDDYHLVAYGNDLRWMTTDAMVEDLLQGDLKALQLVLSETADDGLLSSKIDHLLLPLKHVTASELNADVVEAALGKESHESYEEIVSADYVRDIQKSILGALRQIYTRIAKQLWWQVALTCVIVTTVVWALSTSLWGMLCGALCLAGGSFLFTRRVRRILTDALGSQALAERAVSIAHNSKRTHIAHALILVPSAISTLLVGMMLPAMGLLGSSEREAMPDSLPTSTGAPPTIPAKPADQSPTYDLPAKSVQPVKETPVPMPPKVDPESSNKPSPKPTPKKTEVAPTKPKQSLDDLLK